MHLMSQPARFCDGCGNAMLPGQRFCSNCGRPVLLTGDRDVRRTRRWLLIGGLAAVLAIVGSTVGVVAARGGNSEGTTAASKPDREAVQEVKAWLSRCPQYGQQFGFQPDALTTLGADGRPTLITVVVPFRGGNWLVDADLLTNDINDGTGFNIPQTQY